MRVALLRPRLLLVLKHLAVLSTFDHPGADPDEIDTSAAFVESSAQRPANALLTYTPGRDFVKEAVNHTARLRMTSKASRTAVLIVGDFKANLGDARIMHLQPVVDAARAFNI